MSPEHEHEHEHEHAAIDRWALVARWRGVALAAVALVVTLWLGVTGQLILYIHPRYVVFTMVMAVIAFGLLLASVLLRHGHAHDDEPLSRSGKVLTVAGAAVTLVLAAAMVVVPPATLSSATAIQRDIDSSTVGADAQSVSGASGKSASAFSKFTVLDWSSLLRQTSAASFYTGKPADVTGFVTPDAQDPDNVFFVSRFVITCCAVDAQPVGVPVYLPNWKSTVAKDKWVRILGGFTANPSSRSSQQIALVPTRIAVVTKPKQPYLF